MAEAADPVIERSSLTAKDQKDHVPAAIPPAVNPNAGSRAKDMTPETAPVPINIATNSPLGRR